MIRRLFARLAVRLWERGLLVRPPRPVLERLEREEHAADMALQAAGFVLRSRREEWDREQRQREVQAAIARREANRRRIRRRLG